MVYEPLKCPECKSTNIFFQVEKDEYECLSCGHKWPKTAPRPIEAPVEKKYPIEEWNLVYTPHLEDRLFDMQYCIRGSWSTYPFKSLDEFNAFMEKGGAVMYVHPIRGKGSVTWTPVRISPFHYQPDMKFEKNDLEYTLQQPYITSMEPETWKWRVTVYNKKTYESTVKELSEDDLKRMFPAKLVEEALAKKTFG